MKAYKLEHPTIQKIFLPFFLIICFLAMGYIGWEIQNAIINSFIVVISLVLVYEYLKMFGSVEYNQYEIIAKNVFQESLIFRWTDIGSVKGFGRSLRFFDRQGNRMFSVDKDLAGIEHFIDYAANQTSNLFYQPVGHQLKPNPWGILTSTLVVLGIGIVITWVTYTTSSILGIVAGIAYLVWIIAEFRKTTFEIILGSDSIVTRSISAQNEYLASKISSIELVVKKARNRKNFYVAINVGGKGPKQLSTYGFDSILLYMQLKSWLNNVKQRYPTI